VNAQALAAAGGDDLARARSLVAEAGGPALLERLDALEAARALGPRAPDVARPVDAGEALDADVILAGGGLSLLLAPALARLGARVVVVDRHRAGEAHREWNASAAELRPLIAEGLVDEATLDALVVARYRHGVCRWHGGGSYPVNGVLDHAVDAGPLLRRVRAVAEARGVRVLDHHAIVAEHGGPHGVRVRLKGPSGPTELSARLLVDARGASSPYASADLLCPTVGGVLEGLTNGDAPDELDPTVGDILATIDGVDEGRQHIWEGFPGRAGETTVYLFYYADRTRVAPGSLLALYARFFATRPRYKRGDARLVRPTFGYIPGWSRLTPAPAPTMPRIALFGDVAARHSPLTYCGFGAMLRSFRPSADRIAALLDAPAATHARPLGPLLPDASIHGGTGALSAMMSRPSTDPRRAHDLNRLLDAAFSTLHTLGDGPYRALLQDAMEPRAFLDFLLKTARIRPQVYRDVFAILGVSPTLRWAARVFSASLSAPAQAIAEPAA
jgi:lycopene cyclase CruA